SQTPIGEAPSLQPLNPPVSTVPTDYSGQPPPSGAISPIPTEEPVYPQPIQPASSDYPPFSNLPGEGSPFTPPSHFAPFSQTPIGEAPSARPLNPPESTLPTDYSGQPPPSGAIAPILTEEPVYPQPIQRASSDYPPFSNLPGEGSPFTPPSPFAPFSQTPIGEAPSARPLNPPESILPTDYSGQPPPSGAISPIPTEEPVYPQSIQPASSDYPPFSNLPGEGSPFTPPSPFAPFSQTPIGEAPSVQPLNPPESTVPTDYSGQLPPSGAISPIPTEEPVYPQPIQPASSDYPPFSNLPGEGSPFTPPSPFAPFSQTPIGEAPSVQPLNPPESTVPTDYSDQPPPSGAISPIPTEEPVYPQSIQPASSDYPPFSNLPGEGSPFTPPSPIDPFSQTPIGEAPSAQPLNSPKSTVPTDYSGQPPPSGAISPIPTEEPVYPQPIQPASSDYPPFSNLPGEGSPFTPPSPYAPFSQIPIGEAPSAQPLNPPESTVPTDYSGQPPPSGAISPIPTEEPVYPQP